MQTGLTARAADSFANGGSIGGLPAFAALFDLCHKLTSSGEDGIELAEGGDHIE